MFTFVHTMFSKGSATMKQAIVICLFRITLSSKRALLWFSNFGGTETKYAAQNNSFQSRNLLKFFFTNLTTSKLLLSTTLEVTDYKKRYLYNTDLNPRLLLSQYIFVIPILLSLVVFCINKNYSRSKRMRSARYNKLSSFKV